MTTYIRKLMPERSVVFTTPGLIDLEAFTTFGISAKPNTTTPIGYFGTGLKYAIAVLARENLEVTLHRGTRTYHFIKEKGEHRGKPFYWISMSKKRGWFNPQTKLPFTTELGKDWDLWQAFRELQANTLDEDGFTTVLDSHTIHEATPFENGKTVIVVRGEKFVEEYYNRERTFLPEAETARSSEDKVQIFEKPSDHIYFRGIRVLDLQRPSMFTYNILSQLQLTEDRTIKYPHEAVREVAAAIARSDNESFISKALHAPKENWESRLDFSFIYQTPSTTFAKLVGKHRDRSSLNLSALSYYSGYYPAPEPPKIDYKKEAREFLIHLRNTINTKPEVWRHFVTADLAKQRDHLWELVKEEDTPNEEIPF